MPIKVGDATQAEIRYRDEKGNQWREYLQAYNGRINLPVAYAGKLGTIVLTYNGDGGTVSVGYTLEGYRIPDILVKGDVGVMLENYSEINDKYLTDASKTLEAAIRVDITNTLRQESPVVRVEVTSVRRVRILATVVKNGIVMEYGRIANVRTASHGDSEAVAVPLHKGVGGVELDPGVYWISLSELDSLEAEKPQPPYYEGEKG